MSIFYDANGVFQWASVAALIAGLGALSSFHFSRQGLKNSKISLDNQKEMNQKKIDADIIAKSRNEKSQQIRQISSELINSAYMCSRMLKSYANYSKYYWLVDEEIVSSPAYEKDVLLMNVQETNEKLSDEFDRFYEEYKLKHMQFSLYFGNSQQSVRLIKLVEEVQNEIDEIDKYRHEYQKETNYESSITLIESLNDNNVKYDEAIENFSSELRSYLKNEWLKIKEGK